MSGIINSAGSKSGVIGQTELDYEEGTWTPTITGYTAGSTQTYSDQTGTYTKIGDICHARFSVRLSAKGDISDNYTFLGGIPYNHTASGGSCMFNTVWDLSGAVSWVGGVCGSTAHVIWLTQMDGTSGTSTGYMSATNDVSGTFGVMGLATYKVAT